MLVNQGLFVCVWFNFEDWAIPPPPLVGPYDIDDDAIVVRIDEHT